MSVPKSLLLVNLSNVKSALEGQEQRALHTAQHLDYLRREVANFERFLEEQLCAAADLRVKKKRIEYEIAEAEKAQ